MAELTKQALRVANNTEFPNNNNGAITPSNLRGFNLNMIDSLVDEISYNADSASWNQQIDSLESFSGSTAVSITNLNASSASQQISINALNVFTASASGLQTGSLLVTASAVSNVITFTKGDASTFNVTVADTTNLGPLNTFTASAEISITNLNASSASQQVSIDALNVFTASQSTASLVTSIDNLNAFTQSAGISITNLNSATQSLFASASLGLITASLSGQTLTFTKGDNTTFGFIIPDVSGSDISALNAFTASQLDINSGYNTFTQSIQAEVDSLQLATGSYTLTSSFNAYTQSNDQRVSSLEANSASVNTSISALNTFTASQSTASLVTSIDNLNTFSASALVSISNLNSTTESLNTSVSNLNSATSSLFASASLGLTTASFDNGTRNLTFTKGDASTFSVNIPDISGSAGNFVTTSSFNSYTSSNDQRVSSLETNSGSVNTSITNLNSATSSLFTSASLGLTTASISGVNLTFTKGDGTQFTLQTATGSVVSASFAESASYAQFATDIYLNVKNTTGAQLNKGTVVRIIGAVGDNALVATASWEDDTTSSNTLGFLYENIPNDSFGKVITQGTLLGINTDPVLGYTAGQIIYLSSSGQFTNVIPPAPYHEVRLGQVLRAQQNNGSVYILIQNGYELSELHDVNINTGSLANNNLLAYNSASGQWENKTLTEVGATTTASFNSYTSSTDGRLTNIESTTASLNTSVTNLNSATASLFTSASLTLTTASVNLNTITFTKGDGTTFPLIVNTGSAATIDTGSFATTGSNAFIGNQAITGSLVVSGSTTIIGELNTTPVLAPDSFPGGIERFNIPILSGSNNTIAVDAGGSLYWVPIQNTLNISSSIANVAISQNQVSFTNASGNNSSLFPTYLRNSAGAGKFIGISGDPSLASLTGASTTNPAIIIQSGSASTSYYTPIEFESSQSFTDGRVTFTRNVAMLENLEVTGSITASLQEGYVWVGDAAGRTTTVATSSFGGGGAAFPFVGDAQISGSLGVTGSVSGFVNTLAISSDTASMNFNDGNFFTLQLVSGSITHLTATNIKPGQTINLLVLTDSGSAGGSGSLTFSPTFKFAGGFDYTPTQITASQDLVSFVTFDTTQILAAQVKNLL